MIHKQYTLYRADPQIGTVCLKMIHKQYTLYCVDPQKGTVCQFYLCPNNRDMLPQTGSAGRAGIH